MAKTKETNDTPAEVLEPVAVAAVAEDGPGTYRVSWNDLEGTYEARDRAEAWAYFCDAHKTYPSPNTSLRTITKVS